MTATLFGEWVKLIRIDAGLSQTDLARLAKTSRTHLVALEGGHMAMTETTLARFAQAFGMTTTAFIQRGIALREQEECNQNALG